MVSSQRDKLFDSYPVFNDRGCVSAREAHQPFYLVKGHGDSGGFEINKHPAIPRISQVQKSTSGRLRPGAGQQRHRMIMSLAWIFANFSSVKSI